MVLKLSKKETLETWLLIVAIYVFRDKLSISLISQVEE